MKIKAISLWEPWASLIACKAKRWETRGWATNYRGPLLICAAKGGLRQVDLRYLLQRRCYQGGLAPLVGRPLDVRGRFPVNEWPGVRIDHLQFGMAVALADLTDCRPTGALTGPEIGTDEPFGDFYTGRYAWKLENICRLKRPFPVKGKQGLFLVESNSELEELIHGKARREQ